ncbi:MAG: hypothetical protein RRA92_05155 [Gemmatimonadota bacterium]|nr:hypothetical protein [Gemmatimonadota bacterium]
MSMLDRIQRLAAEIKRRRVLEVVAVYGGLSFAFLEGYGIVAGNLGVGRSLELPLTLLFLFGLPVVVACGWIFDVDARGRVRRTPESADLDAGDDRPAVPRRRRWRLRTAAFATAILLVASTWYTTKMIEAGSLSDPRGSYVVLPIRTPGSAPEDRRAAQEAARRLTRQLQGWENVSVVEDFVVEGMLARSGLADGEVPTLAEALDMAAEQDVGTLVGLSTDIRDGRADLQAALYDVGGRELLGPSLLESGAPDSVDGLVTPIAQHVLQLRAQGVSPAQLRGESPNTAAHAAFSAGLDALHDWRLAEAESRFREAIRIDSLFASAHHKLALTLYWSTVRDAHRIVVEGPEIARLSRRAVRLADLRVVRPGFRAHFEAFAAFWAGEYDEARARYRALLARDPHDLDAWLLLGSVEFYDPSLARVSPLRVLPRRNLNVARRAFERAVELAPEWQVSYGLLTDIDDALLAAALHGSCPAFAPPGEKPRPMFDLTGVGEMAAFCPVAEDSIVWLRPEQLDAERRRRAVTAALSLAGRTRELLERWARVYPDQARPHEELADWFERRRGLLGCRADPEEVDRHTQRLFREVERSVALRPDAAPSDLASLAVLHLATGDVRKARATLMAALDRVPAGAPAPRAATNLLLAFGEPERALRLTEPLWSQDTYAIRDPDGGGVLDLGDIAAPMARLRHFGAAGKSAEAGRALAALLEHLDSAEFSDRQAAFAQRVLLGMGAEAALALDAKSRSRWFRGWEDAGLEVPLVWRGFLASDGAASSTAAFRAAALLDSAVVRIEADTAARPVDYYLTGLLALRTGRPGRAVRLLDRLESCPLEFRGLEPAWGLRTLAMRHLADALESIGDTARARDARARFAALRPDADRGEH